MAPALVMQGTGALIFLFKAENILYDFPAKSRIYWRLIMGKAASLNYWLFGYLNDRMAPVDNLLNRLIFELNCVFGYLHLHVPIQI